MPFVKGGPPGPGRPKKNEEMRTALRAALAIKDPATGLTDRKAVVQALLKEAKRGNVDAIKHVFDRIDGRVKDQLDVEHTGEVTIRVVRDRATGAAPLRPAPDPDTDPGRG
jgi:hypothetical protein